MGRSEHWDEVYERLSTSAPSWYEGEPATSLRLIAANPKGTDAAVIDVGGGTAELVDHLLARGHPHVALLDVSERALDEVRRRLGDRADRVSFIAADVLQWTPSRRYDVWHDRAVFHFLVEERDRLRYVATAAEAVAPGGVAIVATFAADGPTSCSGLPVARYSPDALATVFAPEFSPAMSERVVHVTPGGVVQPFTWCVLVRTS